MTNDESIPSQMKTLPISKEEYEDFLSLQIKDRYDRWAVFSVDGDENVWPYVCRKRTPRKDRQHIETKEHPLLATVVGNLIRVRDSGGRFFVNQDGVFYLEGDSEPPGSIPVQFIKWRPDGTLIHCCMKRDFLRSLRHSETQQPQPQPISYAELQAKRRVH